jgi:hypothetical protein
MDLYLKLILPITLATIVANAEPLNYQKTLPLDKQIAIETPFTAYDNRIRLYANPYNKGGALIYERLKPESAYIGFGTSIYYGLTGISATGGYNFLLTPNDLLTPFAGFIYYPGRYNNIFAAWGVEYDHAFTDTFSAGVNFSNIVSENFNYAIGVPFTVNFGPEKRWEVQIEPVLRHATLWSLPIYSTTVNCSLGYRF